jgi:hypothetical protein
VFELIVDEVQRFAGSQLSVIHCHELGCLQLIVYDEARSGKTRGGGAGDAAHVLRFLSIFADESAVDWPDGDLIVPRESGRGRDESCGKERASQKFLSDWHGAIFRDSTLRLWPSAAPADGK